MRKSVEPRFWHLMALILACELVTASAVSSESATNAEATLVWDADAGVVLVTSVGKGYLDRNRTARGPLLRFSHSGVPASSPASQVEQRSARELALRYQFTGPDDNRIDVTRVLTLTARDAETELVEEFTLIPRKTITVDMEVKRPFSLLAGTGQVEVVLPLYSGWARTFPLDGAVLRGEWQLGHSMRNLPSHQLGLPLVQVGQEQRWLATICADPFFSSLYELSVVDGQVMGAVRYRYTASKVPLAAGQKEVRRFGIWLALSGSQSRTTHDQQPFDRSLDAFFRLMLPDVPPGPQWLHEIAMVGYDYLSDNGAGWEKDVQELARLLTPDQRRRVALCFHGWYETIGGYGYDEAKREMKPEWTAMARTRKVHFTQDEVRRRLQAARDLGFRVLWYFGDGVLQDSGAPCYRGEWDLVDEQGQKVTGWTGPDTWGKTFARNPAHPQVFQWYRDYLTALLKAFGPAVDGFVWDETNYIRTGAIARIPEPAYCDRAMMQLVKSLTQMVHVADPEKVFLSSENIYLGGKAVPGYGLVADGVYQDSWCLPEAWSYGLFPAWRNGLWSCNWWPITQFPRTRWGVEHYGVPVAISNGWEDDRGPSEWNPSEREQILALFRERLARPERVRYLTVDPATFGLRPVLSSDPLPEPAPGEVNWALVSRGSTASASSVNDFSGGQYGPSGLIDGRRDAVGWGQGHGWASASRQPLPQWAEIDFSAPRPISRFVVVTYHRDGGDQTAGRWGVTDYTIQVWDEATDRWTTAVQEDRGRVMMARVHRLDQPVRTAKIRILVTRVAAEDQVARLLQLEAWGRE